MAILLDSGFIYAIYNKDDVNHKTAVQLLSQIEHGEFGTQYITDYLFDETMTLIFAKGGLERAISAGKLLINAYNFLEVSRPVFLESWNLFQHQKMSFTDCSSIVIMRKHRIEFFATFDRGFKGIVHTIGV